MKLRVLCALRGKTARIKLEEIILPRTEPRFNTGPGPNSD